MSGTTSAKLEWRRPTVREFTLAEAGVKGIVSPGDIARARAAQCGDAGIGHNGGPPLAADPLVGLTQKQIFRDCIWISGESTCLKLTLLCIARYLDDEAKGCSMSYSQIARECGFDESTAKREVKRARRRWLLVEVGKGTLRPKGAENLYHGVCPPDLVARLREARFAANAGVAEGDPIEAIDARMGWHRETPSSVSVAGRGGAGRPRRPDGVAQGDTDSRILRKEGKGNLERVTEPEQLAMALGGKRASKTATGWVTLCPAHDDSSPSLSVGTGRNGGLVVHCHAGCTQRDVIAALAERRLSIAAAKEKK